MTEFKKENLTTEDAFWVMWYFLEAQTKLSENTFDITDILSASEPFDWNGNGIKMPADSAMVDYWNEALEKYKKHGKPEFKKLKK